MLAVRQRLLVSVTHWSLVRQSGGVAEFVVVHEMAHLREPHHTPGFWRIVERAMPDFELRKTWLIANGADVEGL